jgi:hypothetical protein
MKVVHKNTATAIVQDKGHWKDSGREAELAGDWDMAAAIYENAIKINKNNAKELKTINAAIAAYEELYAARLPTKNRKVIEISSKLNKTFGLVNRQGQNLYDPEPLASLRKGGCWCRRESLDGSFKFQIPSAKKQKKQNPKIRTDSNPEVWSFICFREYLEPCVLDLVFLSLVLGTCFFPSHWHNFFILFSQTIICKKSTTCRSF